MKKFIRVIRYFILGLFLLLIFAFFVVYHNIYYPENIRNLREYIILNRDWKIIDKFRLIKIGMSETQVTDILGKPESVDLRPWIPQWHGDPDEYGKRIPNPNKTFWYYSGDFEMCIVFDKDGRVSYVNWGGTTPVQNKVS